MDNIECQKFVIFLKIRMKQMFTINYRKFFTSTFEQKKKEKIVHLYSQ